MTATYDPLIDEITLNWVRVQVANAVTPEFAETVRPEIVRREVWGQLVYALRAKVLADQLPPERETAEKTFRFPVPASPWQQFKGLHAETWWLRWLVRRRPVRTVDHVFRGELVVDLTRHRTYPEARISADRMGSSYRVAILNASANWWDET